MDYRNYTLTMREYLKVFLLAMGISLIIAYLFFDNWRAFICLPVAMGIVYRHFKKEGLRRQRNEIAIQFLDAMRVVSTALLAGFSLENAWREAEKEVRVLHGEKSHMFLELKEMNRSVELSVPLEQLLEDFAYRSGVEDIISFSEVFSIAKRSGGNFVKIIETTTDHMRQKQETEQEIEVLTAGRKMEQKVMNLIPILILAYLRVSSGDYLEILYGNAAGILFMCICLLAYLFAFYIAEKILSIQI